MPFETYTNASNVTIVPDDPDVMAFINDFIMTNPVIKVCQIQMIFKI